MKNHRYYNSFPRGKLNDSLALVTWFAAVRTLESDFEKKNALKVIMGMPLNNQQFSEVLVTTSGIDAEYEQVTPDKRPDPKNVPSDARALSMS